MNRLSFFEYYVARRIASDRDRRGLALLPLAKLAVGIAGFSVLGLAAVIVVAVGCAALWSAGLIP